MGVSPFYLLSVVNQRYGTLFEPNTLVSSEGRSSSLTVYILPEFPGVPSLRNRFHADTSVCLFYLTLVSIESFLPQTSQRRGLFGLRVKPGGGSVHLVYHRSSEP